METSTKYKLCATSAALAVGCAISYIIYKQRRRPRDSVDLFDYLTIKTVTKEESCDQVVAELRRRCQKHRALGFDCEWVTENGKRQPIALVQLSSFDGYCGLFRLSIIKALPTSLKDLLEDEKIYKVGVAPADDGKYLCHDYAVVLKSTLDVRHLAQLTGHETGGLAMLSSTLLGATLDKSWRIRCSDWEAKDLSARQVQYAAIDAHVSIRIFVILMEQLGRKRTAVSWLLGTNDTVWSHLDDHCWKYADVHYKNKTRHNSRIKTDSAKEKVYKEPLLQTKPYTYATRTRPLYNNCFLEAPDGDLLCTCDKKKASWYVEKELADIVKEEPLTVRLRFEPAGRSVGDVGRYYQLKKENKCVVCGTTNSYIRKNVVPREYRKIFPDIMKDHSSHDVVLLCVECHQLSNVRDQAVRERLANMCDAPLASQQRTKYTEDTLGKKIKSAGRALLYQSQKHVLPDARRKELEDILLQYYPQHDEVTQELLKEAAELQVVFENADYESHGVKVVEYFLERDGLLRLEEIWREHFLSSMQPRYMPALWSVKHNEERLRVKSDEGRLTQDDLKSMGLTTL